MKRNYKQDKLERMCDNLYWKLRNWVVKEGDTRCVTVSQIWDKVYDNAPKAIRESGRLMREVVVSLWNVDHDYTVDECEMASADLNDCMIEYYGGC